MTCKNKVAGLLNDRTGAPCAQDLDDKVVGAQPDAGGSTACEITQEMVEAGGDVLINSGALVEGVSDGEARLLARRVFETKQTPKPSQDGTAGKADGASALPFEKTPCFFEGLQKLILGNSLKSVEMFDSDRIYERYQSLIRENVGLMDG